MYDALNVLMAMDIITRDKKEIKWNGMPGRTLDDVADMAVGGTPAVFVQCLCECVHMRVAKRWACVRLFSMPCLCSAKKSC